MAEVDYEYVGPPMGFDPATVAPPIGFGATAMVSLQEHERA